jgi:two-component system NarL family sensor kinase
VPQDVSLTLFRILQESLQNAVKHSSAQHVQVQLLGTSREVQLIVRDDGTGFNVDAAMNSHGLGLISMRERVNLVNGKIFIASKPMGGTEITVHVPIFALQDAITDRAPHLTSGAA